MGRIGSYLLMRTPAARMGDEKVKAAQADTIPTSRIVVSIIGLLIGIVASFFITGLEAYTTAKQISSNTQVVSKSTAPVGEATGSSAPSGPQINPFTWKRFWTACLISLVVCGLSYQALYFSLRLYQQEPGLLILFVSFQYGYFWQSALKGASAVLK
jgi:hypothetical protein